MATLLNKDDLPNNQTAYRFEGYQYGDIDMSFFMTETPVGRGSKLHTHPYPEVLIIQEGQATFTVGDDTVDTHAGQILIVPPGTPHKYVNSGAEVMRKVSIHPVKQMVTSWLE
jgi:quercetin dioxygenase-like cupin family protein